MRNPPLDPLSEILSKVKIVSQEEAEESDMVVCCTIGMTRYFTDDIETVCAECGTGIFHRPHAPKKPRKVCINCAADMAEKDAKEKGEK